jgi:glucose/arabinose dehydrogenase
MRRSLARALNGLLALTLTTTVGPTAWAQTNNPINGSAPIARWSFVLEDVVQIPNSPDGTPRLEYLTSAGPTGRAYVIDQNGPIYSFDPSAANPTAALFLDLDSAVGNSFNSGEAGVRGIAFHPDFNNLGTGGYRKFYTAHSRTASSVAVGNPVLFDSPGGTNHYTVVGEWNVQANGAVDLGSYRELLRIEQPFANHNSGHIGFNPSASAGEGDYGKLFIAVGDGGSANGPFGLSQDIDTSPLPYPHGKILRIDPLASGGNPYSIPSDNPFAGQANRVQETWAYGLRNPHKFDWDPLTGEMYLSDIGQGVVEEINIVRPEANYGWNQREGTYVFAGSSSVAALPANHPTDAFTYPVAQYDHNGTNGISGSSAIVGGTVYRGDDIPELTGMYLFAEFATNPGPIFAVDVDDLVERDNFSNLASLSGGRLSPYVEVEIRDGQVDKDYLTFLRNANGASYTRTDTRWGVGPDGEIYLLNKRDGMVRRIAGVVDLAQGDADRDGKVGSADLARWAAAWGGPGDWSDGNFDASPRVSGSHFLVWQRGTGGTSTIRAIPEPASGLLFATAASSWVARRRGRRRGAGALRLGKSWRRT